MPRAATTADVFNAIAEPRRREIVDLLAGGTARPVGELVARLRLPQPTVSKHLGVLRKVGLVSASRQGRQRLYQINPARLKPVHDWVKTYEQFWDHKLLRIKERAERKAREPSAKMKTPRQK
jgi:DNA-binding transcriptional ArsR family regulator